jgi:hypothetical protein
VGLQNGASLSSRPVLRRKVARALRVAAPLAHGVTAVATMVAKITVAGAARHQVVTVVALMAQVAIRTVAHQPLSTSLTKCPAAAHPSGSSQRSQESIASSIACCGALRPSSPHNTAPHSVSRTRQGQPSPQHDYGPRRPPQWVLRRSLAQTIPLILSWPLNTGRPGALYSHSSLVCPSSVSTSTRATSQHYDTMRPLHTSAWRLSCRKEGTREREHFVFMVLQHINMFRSRPPFQ